MYTFHDIRTAVLAGTRDTPDFPYGVPFDPDAFDPERRSAFADTLSLTWDAARHARHTPIPALPFSAFSEFATTGARVAYDRPYFERRRRLLPLTLAALRGDDALDALHDLLWAICDEYTWAIPAHLRVPMDAAFGDLRPPDVTVDLFAAETAGAVAEILRLLGNRLDPWVARRARDEVERRVLSMFDGAARYGWEAAPHNWAAVCCGSAGTAALLLVDDLDRLAGITDRVVRALDCFLSGFGTDGGCREGIGYWSYGFGHFVFYAEALRAFTRGALDLLADPRARRVAAFPAAVNLGSGRWVGFSDIAHDTHVPLGLVSRLVERTGAPAPEGVALSLDAGQQLRFASAVRNVLWSDPALLARRVPLGGTWLPDLAWLTHRAEIGGHVAAFAAKGGHNDEPHNHNDLGSFTLSVGGHDVLVDLGAGEYTRAYFQAQRYDHLHPSSRGHSVPVIDGAAQRAGRDAEAKVLDVQVGAQRAALTLDLTGAYDVPGLLGLTRELVWQVTSANATLELTDAFTFDADGHAAEEVLVSLTEPHLEDGHVTWRVPTGQVTLHLDEPDVAARVDALDASGHGALPVRVYRLHLHRTSAAASSARLRFTVTPEAGVPAAHDAVGVTQ